MKKNLILAVVGLVFGAIIGLSAANFVTGPSTPKAARTAARASDTASSQPGGAEGLPPNHPDISGMNGTGSPASVSPEAQAAMERADANAGDFQAQMSAAQIFYKLKDYNKAELYLTRALELKSDDFDALSLIGHTHYDRRNFTRAAEFYERALAVNPKDVTVLTDLGNTYLFRQPPDYDRAIIEYRKALGVDDKNESVWYFLATAQIERGDNAEALKALSKLEALNPKHPSLASLRERAGMTR